MKAVAVPGRLRRIRRLAMLLVAAASVGAPPAAGAQPAAGVQPAGAPQEDGALRRPGAQRAAELATQPRPVERPALATQPRPVERRVTGRVVRPAADQMAGVAGAWVTLHRVGPDGGAPLDSMQTRAGGSYEFRYRAEGDDVVYFVSASHGGIAYFSSPLAGPVVSGDAAEIAVFDTTAAPVPIQVRGRHIIVGSAAEGEREVIEVYELSNDTSVTVVAADSATPTWMALLPAAARDFAVGESDVAAAAVEADAGRVRVFAPIAPGLKQIAFSYRVATGAFPLSIPVHQPTPVLEILVEDPAGSATGGGLVEVDPVSAEGRTFRRFLAADAPAAGVIQLLMPVQPRLGRGTWLALVMLAIGTAMLIVLARSFSRRRPLGAAPGRVEMPDDPDRLAREIAALDAAFERMPSHTGESEAAYRARREDLKQRLAVALARRGPAR